MDPNHAWVDLSEAVRTEEWSRAAEIAENLIEWLAKGGFPPTITTCVAFDRIACRETCQAIAAWEVV